MPLCASLVPGDRSGDEMSYAAGRDLLIDGREGNEKAKSENGMKRTAEMAAAAPDDQPGEFVRSHFSSDRIENALSIHM